MLNQRTAITRVLARRIMVPGSNPTFLAKQLLESKTEWFDGLRAQVVVVVVHSSTSPLESKTE